MSEKFEKFSCLIAPASESSDDDESFVKDRIKTLLDAANDNHCTEMVEIADGEDENGGMHDCKMHLKPIKEEKREKFLGRLKKGRRKVNLKYL